MTDRPITRSVGYIRCHQCDRKSYSQVDFIQRFCGACGAFHQTPSEYTLGSTLTFDDGSKLDVPLHDSPWPAPTTTPTKGTK